MRKKSLLLVITWIIAAHMTTAQSNKQKSSRQSSGGKTASPCPSSPLDSRLETIPKDFCDVDSTLLYERIEALGLSHPKGEFETTAEFQARNNPLIVRQRIGIQSATFVATIQRSIWPVVTHYDADSQDLKILVIFDMLNTSQPVGSEVFFGMATKRKIIKDDNYEGSNAFGVTKLINRTWDEVYGLAISADSWLMQAGWTNTLTHGQSLTIHVHVDPVTARNLKSSLAVIISGKLANPWIVDAYDRHRPTIEDTEDSMRTTHAIVLDPYFVLLEDSRTGAVIAKVFPDNVAGLNERPK